MKIILRIKMFSMLFATLERRTEGADVGGEQPIVLVLHTLLPIFERVTVIWGQDPAVIDVIYWCAPMI
jgi:hypothetical protein